MANVSTAGRPAAASLAPAAFDDAIDLLEQDHKAVMALFERYQGLVDGGAADADRQSLAEAICALLSVHATVEEELLYPAARTVLGADQRVVDEHASARRLIAQIRSSSPDGVLYDARVKVRQR